MSIHDLNLANSSLEVKSSGNIDFSKDLELPEGKTIAELLQDNISESSHSSHPQNPPHDPEKEEQEKNTNNG